VYVFSPQIDIHVEIQNKIGNSSKKINHNNGKQLFITLLHCYVTFSYVMLIGCCYVSQVLLCAMLTIWISWRDEIIQKIETFYERNLSCC